MITVVFPSLWKLFTSFCYPENCHWKPQKFSLKTFHNSSLFFSIIIETVFPGRFVTMEMSLLTNYLTLSFAINSPLKKTTWKWKLEMRSKMSFRTSTKTTKWKFKEFIREFNRQFRRKTSHLRHFKRKMLRSVNGTWNWTPSSGSSAKIIAQNDIFWATFGSRTALRAVDDTSKLQHDETSLSFSCKKFIFQFFSKKIKKSSTAQDNSRWFIVCFFFYYFITKFRRARFQTPHKLIEKKRWDEAVTVWDLIKL